MANKYEGFTNPTIIPDQKYGWEAANQGAQGAIGGIAQYLGQRQQQGQQLQYQQATQLANAQAMSMAYTGQRNPNIDAMLAQNPFGKYIMPQGSQPQGAGTPQPGSNVMSSTLMGVSPAAAMFGAGGNVMPMGSGMQGGQQSQSVQSPSMGGAANFSPFNPIGNGPVTTSATSEFQPYIGMMPKSVTTQNPAGEAVVAGAKEYAGKKAGMAAGAEESESRDIQQLAMVKNAIKPLVDSYDEVYNKGFAGDKYGAGMAKNADFIPQNIFGFNAQKALVPSDVQKATGQFLANKNELVTKLQPLLSQQFGKEGSSRIMEKLVEMSRQEIGDLSTPRDQFHGQLTGTLSSLYRIAKASQAYAKDLAQSGQQSPDPDIAAQEIAMRMSAQDLSPAEQKEMQGMIDDVIGDKSKPKSISDFNPLNKVGKQTQNMPKYNPKTQKLQRNTRTGEYRVISLDGNS